MLNKTNNRWLAAGTVAVMGATALIGQPAHAGSKGRKNVMLGAAAVTAYGLFKHNTKVAAIGAIGTGVAYHNYRQAKHGENNAKAQREAQRQQWYQNRYGRTWRNHYVPAG